MKKRSVFVVLSLTMAVLFCGCAKAETKTESTAKDLSTEIMGTWTLTSVVDAEGNSKTVEEYCAAAGVDASGVEATYTFAEENKVTGAIGGIGVEGTYAVESDKVTCTFASGAATFTYDADANTLSASDANTGIKSVLTK